VKHLYLSDVLTDTMILIAAIWCVGQLRSGAPWRKNHRKRLGPDRLSA